MKGGEEEAGEKEWQAGNSLSLSLFLEEQYLENIGPLLSERPTSLAHNLIECYSTVRTSVVKRQQKSISSKVIYNHSTNIIFSNW